MEVHHSSLPRTQVPKIGGVVRTRTMQTHKTWPTWLPTFGAFALPPPKAARSTLAKSPAVAGRGPALGELPGAPRAQAASSSDRDPGRVLRGLRALDPAETHRESTRLAGVLVAL